MVESHVVLARWLETQGVFALVYHPVYDPIQIENLYIYVQV